jgi:hypothetical protein
MLEVMECHPRGNLPFQAVFQDVAWMPVQMIPTLLALVVTERHLPVSVSQVLGRVSFDPQ